MKISVLVEDTSYDHLKCEHGLSLLIEYLDKSYLLDTGMTDLFIENAKEMNIDIFDVDHCILSHGHNDHSGGLSTYLSRNKNINVYAMNHIFDRHFSGSNGKIHEISVPKQVIKKYKDRFIFIQSLTKIEENVYLVPHITKDLEEIAQKNKMYIKKGNYFVYDDFSHELSLVFDTSQGLVVFNSCSHAGVINIINEIQTVFPDKAIYAYIGGLHLKGKKNDQEICVYTNEEVEKIIDVLDKNTKMIYTGHCTGQIGYQRLEKRIGKKLHQLTTGKVIEI